jgi:hypothetical protein
MIDFLFFIGLLYLFTIPMNYKGEKLNVIGGFIAIIGFPAYIIIWYALTGRL